MVNTWEASSLSAEHDANGVPIRQVRIVDFAGEPTLGPLIDGTGKFEVVNLALDTRGLMLALSLDDGNQFRIERHDAITGELVGDPAVGYRDFVSSGAVHAVRHR